MAEPLHMLDQALTLGRRELEFLVAGDLDAAEDLAFARGELINSAMDGRRASQDKQALIAKLQELQALQDRLTAQVEAMRDEARRELLKVKQEGRRMDGYRSGVGLDSGARSRFVSKRG